MKHFIFLLLAFTITSCIPVSLAPDFQKRGYKVKEAKKFKRKLPEQQAFIFVDPKEEGEFYNFINTKYELYDFEVDAEVPFRIDNQLYYLSFYEVEKMSTAIDVLGITDDVLIEDSTWYIVLTIMDNESKDCLKSSHKNHKLILKYLKDLKQEYLHTENISSIVKS
ncbi:hypothetical protein [Winogradskyella sp.]|uniref:hypothetical protein n=1 Tax=Winogradskyella sp. TaxID=1883156 RepID=UPI00260C6DF1|nr:hypothetical protein [Winogradskyella sp.]